MGVAERRQLTVMFCDLVGSTALAERHDAAVVVAQHLELDVPRRDDVLLYVHVADPERARERRVAEVDQRRLARSGLSAKADKRIMIAFLHGKNGCGRRFEVTDNLSTVGRKKRDGGLRVGIGHRIFDGVVKRCLASRTVDIGQDLALLEHLLRNPRLVLSRSQLFEAVWGYDFGPRSNALEVYVSYLRRKLESGGEPRLIHTVRGVGYVLREP